MKSLDTATVDAQGWHDVGSGPGSPAGRYLRWLTIADPKKAVLEDVQRIREHSLWRATSRSMATSTM